MSKAILLARLDHIGDLIITSSLFPQINKQRPEWSLHLLARPHLAPLFCGHGAISHFHSWDGKRPLDELLHEISPEVLFVFEPHEELYHAAEKVGISQRIGFYRDEMQSRCLTTAIPYHKHDSGKHEAESCAAVLEAAGICVEKPFLPALQTNECGAEEWIQIKSSLTDLPHDAIAVINPTSADPRRQWQDSFFAEVAAWLAHDRMLHPILIGSDSSNETLLRLAQRLREMSTPHTNLAGKLSLGGLHALLGQARLHISVDTGTAHLAAASGCPHTLVLFGRTGPEYGPQRWTPLGTGVRCITTRIKRFPLEPTEWFWRRGFRSLSPKLVIGELDRLLVEN